ncbi:hypothetical protein SPHINGOT1_80016 [Sphingomonas sp. T1]|nr:hypothetical protein SPHINGOT1_80016 [Sphingomonas sp. T1]
MPARWSKRISGSGLSLSTAPRDKPVTEPERYFSHGSLAVCGGRTWWSLVVATSVPISL